MVERDVEHSAVCLGKRGEQNVVSIRDVAKRAGVSTTAVSFVLNGRYDQLSESTIQRIRTAIDELDYRPSAFARGLVTKKSHLIGVLSTQIVHPVETFMVSALIEEARKRGFSVFISDEAVHSHRFDEAEESQFLDHQVDTMIRHRVAGIVASAPLSDDRIKDVQRSSIPIVALDRFTGACDCVNVDFTAGSYMAMKHLYEVGRRKIIYLCYGNPQNEEGVQRAVKDFPGLAVVYRAQVVKPMEAFRETVGAFNRGIDFDGVYVTSDWYAIGVYRALEQLGLRVPQDVAVVGFDDTFAGFFSPALTTVSQPLGDIGRKAFELVLGRINGTLRLPPQDVRLAPTLVKRESSGCFITNRESLVQGIWERDTN